MRGGAGRIRRARRRLWADARVLSGCRVWGGMTGGRGRGRWLVCKQEECVEQEKEEKRRSSGSEFGVCACWSRCRWSPPMQPWCLWSPEVCYCHARYWSRSICPARGSAALTAWRGLRYAGTPQTCVMIRDENQTTVSYLTLIRRQYPSYQSCGVSVYRCGARSLSTVSHAGNPGLLQYLLSSSREVLVCLSACSRYSSSVSSLLLEDLLLWNRPRNIHSSQLTCLERGGHIEGY